MYAQIPKNPLFNNVCKAARYKFSVAQLSFFEAAAKWGKQKRVRKLKQLGEENKLKKEWCGY